MTHLHPKNLLCYIASGILFLSYVTIFISGMNTENVSLPYQRFFIDSTSSFYEDIDVTPDLLATYTEGRTVSYQSSNREYYNLGRGWMFPEEEGAWAIGPCSEWYFFVTDTSSDHELILYLSSESIPPSPQALYVDEVRIGILTPQEDRLTITIPANSLKPGLQCFSIRSETPAKTKNLFLKAASFRSAEQKVER